MKTPFQRGFTILELLIVIGIMGLLGTVSVSGFRGLRKGMEERGTLQTVNEFVRSAYLRAVIDRVPVHVYFWNETISDEDSGVSADKKLVVVGHAVAVRRAGRVTAKNGQFLYDEFGDLSDERYTDEEGEHTEDGDYVNDPGRYLYRMKTDAFERSLVSSLTVQKADNLKEYMMSLGANQQVYIGSYGYYVKTDASGDKVIGVGQWKVGDPYGFAIAELSLPKNFIFGSASDAPDSVTSPEKAVSDVIVITGSGQMPKSQSISVCGQKLATDGTVGFKEIGKSEDPSQDR